MAAPGNYTLASFAGYVLRIVLALIPWAAALYLHHWLDESGTWSAEMEGRALMSVVILSVGMGTSFLVYGRLRSPHGAKP